MSYVLLAAVFFFGASYSRYFGADIPGLLGRRYVRVAIGVLVGFIIAYVATQDYKLSVLGAGLLAAWWTPGHGSHTDLGKSPPTMNEFYDPILKKFFKEGSWGSFSYDFCGVALRYLLMTVSTALVLFLVFGDLKVLLFAPVGVFVPVVYLACSKIPLPSYPYLRGSTEWAELFRGGVIYATFFWVLS